MTKIGNQMHAAIAALIKKGSEWACDHDEQELHAFAKQLRGVGDAKTTDECLEILPELQVPQGFCHARYTIYEVIGTKLNGEHLLSEPKYAGGITSSVMKPIELGKIVSTALVFSSDISATSMGQGRWLETFALPIIDRGVMELALVLEPLECNDGTFLGRLLTAIKLGREENARRGIISSRPIAKPRRGRATAFES
ncbi:hypothetical protein [Sphingopyxis sp.]|uniref:hypothetical protein n=1 Tax=Sphingopyxis sp. TaxID=1908224 RepID=UPI002DFD157D|nr:hypothetical protein [Sphingopyxis sp.]